MIARYQTLASRIRMELEELEMTHQAIQRHWRQAMAATVDQDAWVNSVAFNLHGLYSGLERIFELIAIELDGGVIGGSSWHKELLKQMSLDLPDVRPPVLTRETASKLDEYRKFRHLVRNIYATNLDIRRMEPLVAALPELWLRLSKELKGFLDFMHELSHTDLKDS